MPTCKTFKNVEASSTWFQLLVLINNVHRFSTKTGQTYNHMLSFRVYICYYTYIYNMYLEVLNGEFNKTNYSTKC